MIQQGGLGGTAMPSFNNEAAGPIMKLFSIFDSNDINLTTNPLRYAHTDWTMIAAQQGVLSRVHSTPSRNPLPFPFKDICGRNLRLPR